ncbi:maleate cis-trans isomerase family protein [Pelagibius sp.]
MTDPGPVLPDHEGVKTTRRVLLGMLTPSSNTVVEPVTTAMVADLPEVSVHFSRFPVTEITLSDEALAQFEPGRILAAAKLLAQARVAVITWNGTSAAWKGFASDDDLCRQITAETGIPAASSVLAMNEIFAATGVRRIGLVTPYLEAVQERIIASYTAAGYHCVAERHENDPGNFSYSEIGEDLIAQRIREVATAQPDAIAVVCTNLFGARVAAVMEAETGIPVYDTVATGLWKSLVLAGIDTARVTGWGTLFKTRLNNLPSA